MGKRRKGGKVVRLDQVRARRALAEGPSLNNMSEYVPLPELARYISSVVQRVLNNGTGTNSDASLQGNGSGGLGEVLKRSQVAELLQLSEKTVSKLVREGRLPATKIGSEYRFRRSEVLAWMSAQSGQESA